MNSAFPAKPKRSGFERARRRGRWALVPAVLALILSGLSVATTGCAEHRQRFQSAEPQALCPQAEDPVARKASSPSPAAGDVWWSTP